MKPESLDRLCALRGSVAGKLAGRAERFAALAGRHEAGTAPRAVSAFNLFQTPPPVARRMADMLARHLAGNPAPLILEPSAGLGRIVREVVATLPHCRLHLVDSSPECAAELRRLARDGDRVHEADFLGLDPDIQPRFDAVVMNPPFRLGSDVRHIRHALGMLAPGGLLVALCYNGVRQNETLKPLAQTWEVLPDRSFAAEGTSASVAMMTFRP